MSNKPNEKLKNRILGSPDSESNSSTQIFSLEYILILGCILFWICFYLAYPYRELIDDVRYLPILQNKTTFAGLDVWSRLIHHGLLYAQGYIFQASLEKAMFVSVIFHLILTTLNIKFLTHLLGKEKREIALFGVLAFSVHPVSLQTVVHVAQRGEILGSIWSLLAVLVFLLTEKRRPQTFDVLILAFLGSLALLSKESYSLVPFGLLSWLSIQSNQLKSNQMKTWGALALLGSLILVGVRLNSFSQPVINNQSNFQRSEAFQRAFEEGREVSAQDSIILPVRKFSQNLQLQTALVPMLVKIICFPFGLVKDYGYFPYGKDTYKTTLPWFWVGLMILVGGISLGFYFRARWSGEEWILILSPAILYSVYWIFPVYDPLVLYRLYGVVFLFYTVSLPILVGQFKALKSPIQVVYGLVILFGFVRFWEMSDHLRESNLEVNRQSVSYRLHVDRFHAQAKSNIRLVDCENLLLPVLKLVPSTALVYIEIAWCLHEQGKYDQARLYAQKSLEQESVPENIQIALSYLNGSTAPFQVHPSNLPSMGLGNK